VFAAVVLSGGLVGRCAHQRSVCRGWSPARGLAGRVVAAGSAAGKWRRADRTGHAGGLDGSGSARA